MKDSGNSYKDKLSVGKLLVGHSAKKSETEIITGFLYN